MRMRRALGDRLRADGVTAAQFGFQLLIVIIGVYVAIWVQDRVERRSRTQAASRTLEAMNLELAQDENALVNIIAVQARLRERASQLIDLVRSDQPADSAIAQIVNSEDIRNRTFFSRRAAYSTLLGGDRLEYVTDAQLRLRIAELYEHDYTRLSRNGDLYDEIYQTTLRRALLEYWDYKHGRPIPAGREAAVQLSNAAWRVVDFSTYYEGLLRAQLQAVREIRKRLTEYSSS